VAEHVEVYNRMLQLGAFKSAQNVRDAAIMHLEASMDALERGHRMLREGR
jgi:hypothetical protein